MIEPQTADEWIRAGTRNPITKSLALASEQAVQVLRRERRAMFVFGGSGMGKNFIVDRAISKVGRGIRPVYSQPSTYQMLLEDFHRATYARKRNPLPIVLDEAELIFKTARNFNIMKLATDPDPKALRFHEGYRWVAEVEEQRELADGRLVSRKRKVTHRGVSLDAPIIAMTNKNLHDIKGENIEEHAKALTSRVPPIYIPDDVLTAWEYSVWIGLSTNLLRLHNGQGVPLSVRVCATDWFTRNLWNLKQVSPRTLSAVVREWLTAKPALLPQTLESLLKPREERVLRDPPQASDWADLFRANLFEADALAA